MRRILVVDDEPDIIKFLDYALSREHIVSATSDGLVAETLLLESEELFDVVITDYNMPMLSGQHLCNIAHQRNPKCTTIVITGSEDFADEPHADVDIVIKKPFSVMRIMQLVNDTLGA